MSNIDRAVIVDDHELFSDLLSLLLQKHQLFKHIDNFKDSSSFIEFLKGYGNKPVCIFLDYYLIEGNGLSLVQEIRRTTTKACIIFITSSTSPQVIQQLYLAKPQGILSKYCSIATLVECLNSINSGQIYLDSYMRRFLSEAEQTALFTPRELEILKYFDRGYTITETAEKLFLSKHTIVAHRRNMMGKTNTRTIGQLLNYVHKFQLI